MVYEGVAERLYGVSHALRNSMQYQKWMNHFKPDWTPIFNDAPPLNRVSQEASPGSTQGGSSLIQGQDPDSAAAAAAANFLGSLEVLRP